jgi:hypothetical protein
LTAEKGSKDRDRDWVGPFVKAAKAVLEGRTGLKVSDISLNKKERDGYTDFPVMFDGYHTLCFERAAAAKAASSQPVETSVSSVVESGEELLSVTPELEAADSDPAPAATRLRPKRKAKPATVSA